MNKWFRGTLKCSKYGKEKIVKLSSYPRLSHPLLSNCQFVLYWMFWFRKHWNYCLSHFKYCFFQRWPKISTIIFPFRPTQNILLLYTNSNKRLKCLLYDKNQLFHYALVLLLNCEKTYGHTAYLHHVGKAFMAPSGIYYKLRLYSYPPLWEQRPTSVSMWW